MKAKNIISFVLVMAIIATMAFVVFGDVTIGNIRVPGVLDTEKGIKQGLDLVGGSVIVFEPDVENLSTVTAEQLDSAENIIRVRLDSLGQTEATVTRQGEYGIRVEIPNIDDPNEAVAYIGQTAALQFLDIDGNVVMEGNETYVDSATSIFGQTTEYGNSQHYVELSLTKEGRAAFKTATENAIARTSEGGNVIVIALDGVPYSWPRVNEVIDSDKCIITGDFDKETAKELADVINSGRLPFSLKDTELRAVGPTLGAEALDTSLFAALVGVLLVMIFILIVYRLPGLVADVSLVAYISVVCLIMTGLYRTLFDAITLTLPGIAGIILSIGMAVDANVVIFERIKDELNGGKSVGASVDSGFKRALTAVIDANVTTFISCVVLYLFGTGSIKGFAITLGIGVVVSFVTAIFLTKLLLKIMVGFGIRNPWLYGASKRRDA
ncbi:MAG: protein translocase subunit SecD [Clostridia bacterium]